MIRFTLEMKMNVESKWVQNRTEKVTMIKGNNFFHVQNLAYESRLRAI